MLKKPDIIITVTDVKVGIYRAGNAAPVAEFAYTAEHIGNDLHAALVAQGARTAIILLETSDVNLQTEAMPKAGWYDQRKMVQRRLDLVFGQNELRSAIALPVGDDGQNNYFFVSAPNAPQLTAIYNALAKAQTWLMGVCIFAAEYWGHTQDDKHKNRITLLNIGTHVRLLAEESHTLALTRLLPPAVATNPQLCEQELQITQSYLLRRGWAMGEKYTLRTHGVSAAAGYAKANALPHEVMDHHTAPWPSLIQHLLNGGKPFGLLVPSRLRQRQQLLRLNEIVTRSLRATAAVALLMLIISAGMQINVMYRNSELHSKITTLPESAPGYERRQTITSMWQAQGANIFSFVNPLAGLLPPNATISHLDWQAQPHHATLNIGIQGLPTAQHEALIENLAGLTQAQVQQSAGSGTQTGVLGTASTNTTTLQLSIEKGQP